MKRRTRTLLLLLHAVAITFGALLQPSVSNAAAPLHESQVQGFHRTKVGVFEVTALLDGTSTFSPQWLKADPAIVQSLAGKHFEQPDKMSGTVSAFLINTGQKLVLVDTGAGGFWGNPAFGHLS